MMENIFPCLLGHHGMLAGAASLVANVGLSSCNDIKPVRTFRVFVSDQSGGCEIRVDGDIVSVSGLVAIARARDGRRVDARIVSPASGVTPKCAQLAQRAMEHARFATITFNSSRHAAAVVSRRGFTADERKD